MKKKMENRVKLLNPIQVNTNVTKFNEQPESRLQTQLITSISFSLIQLVSENRSKPFFKSKIKAKHIVHSRHFPFQDQSVRLPSSNMEIFQNRRDKFDNRSHIHGPFMQEKENYVN